VTLLFRVSIERIDRRQDGCGEAECGLHPRQPPSTPEKSKAP
jgi:hypothetical protein